MKSPLNLMLMSLMMLPAFAQAEHDAKIQVTSTVTLKSAQKDCGIFSKKNCGGLEDVKVEAGEYELNLDRRGITGNIVMTLKRVGTKEKKTIVAKYDKQNPLKNFENEDQSEIYNFAQQNLVIGVKGVTHTSYSQPYSSSEVCSNETIIEQYCNPNAANCNSSGVITTVVTSYGTRWVEKQDSSTDIRVAIELKDASGSTFGTGSGYKNRSSTATLNSGACR